MSFEEWWEQSDRASLGCEREAARRVWEAAQAQLQLELRAHQILFLFADALRTHLAENLSPGQLRATNSTLLFKAFADQLDFMHQATAAAGEKECGRS